MFRNALIFTLLISVLVFAPVTHAEDTFIIETFEVGGSTHDARYPDTPDGVLALQAAQEAVERSIEVFQPLWIDTTGVSPFAYFVDVKADGLTGHPEVVADANMITTGELPADVLAENDHRRPAQVCQINVYLPGLRSVEAETLFYMAHEISHCYQEFHDPGLLTLVESVRGWWTEGSAHWMAALAYPSGAPTVLIDWHATFVTRYRASMFDRNYDNAFYWLFLESELGGAQAVVDLIKGLRGLDTLENYSGYLDTLAPYGDGYMHEFARALAQDQIDYQPNPDDLVRERILTLDDLPATLPFDVQPDYSLDFTVLTVTGLEEGQGLTLRPIDFYEAGSRISAANRTEGDGFIELDDDAEIELCPGAAEMSVDLVISRAAQGSRATIAERQLRIDTTECDEQEPEFVGVPECIVGTWDVIEIPDLNVAGLDSPEYTWESFQVTFGEDGAMTGNVSNMSTSVVIPDTNMPLTVTVSVSGMSGFLTYVPEGEMSNRYLTEMNDWDIGTYTASANVGGQILDLTPMIDAMLSEPSLIGMQPPTYIDCVRDSQLDYWVLSEYLAGPYALQRAP